MGIYRAIVRCLHDGVLDEDGVEATAYTQVNFFGAMPPNGRADMILDRPFIYGIITHDDTILFIGVCENPAES